MEIAELLELCTTHDVVGKILDLIIIILYLCGKKKTAEELEAKRLKKIDKETAKAEKYAKKTRQSLAKVSELEKGDMS